MSSVASSHSAGLTIATPGDWLVVDLDELRSERDARKLLSSRLAEVPGLAGHEGAIAKSIARSADTARKQGVLFTAVLAELPDGNSLVIANLAVAVVDAPPLDASGNGGSDPDGSAELSAAADGIATTERGVEERAVDKLMMPAGPAVRVARIHTLELFDGGPTAGVLTVEYWFSTPERRVAVLTFSTPSLGLHRELATRFHEIALSLRFIEDGGPADAAASSDRPAAEP